MIMKFDTFGEVIALWQTAEVLATDLGENGVTVRAWRNRNSIPPEYWRRVSEAAAARGKDVTIEDMQAIAERKAATDEGRAA